MVSNFLPDYDSSKLITSFTKFDLYKKGVYKVYEPSISEFMYDCV